MKKNISIVIPSYNEASNIDKLLASLNETINALPYSFKIIFVDDGSKDETVSKLKEIASQQDNVYYVELSRNFGHQNALKAGLDLSDADAVISMDGDLQHPPALIPELIKHWENGVDIVYTIRKDHQEVPMMKRKTSNMFYNLMNSLSDIELEAGTADL